MDCHARYGGKHMKCITFVDAPTFLPQPVIDRLMRHGEVIVYEDMPTEAQVKERLDKADVVVAERVALPAGVFGCTRRLKHIILPTTGVNRVDIGAASRAGILVSNTPDYCQSAVAEHAIGMLIAISKRFVEANTLVCVSQHATYVDHVAGLDLRGKRLGIVGFGGIGRSVADLGQGLGMEVVFYNRTARSAPFRQLTLEHLMATANFVVVCLPLNEYTLGRIDRQMLSSTRPNTVIVGISGSELFDTDVLDDLLASGHLFGVGIDGPPGERLRPSAHVLQSPDTGWFTQDALKRNIDLVAETVELGLRGEYRFVVPGV
jgi:phosphoglycerate dehydrogenase-like enzyme